MHVEDGTQTHRRHGGSWSRSRSRSGECAGAVVRYVRGVLCGCGLCTPASESRVGERAARARARSVRDAVCGRRCGRGVHYTFLHGWEVRKERGEVCYKKTIRYPAQIFWYLHVRAWALVQHTRKLCSALGLRVGLCLRPCCCGVHVRDAVLTADTF
jgi:hypothetical protein